MRLCHGKARKGIGSNHHKCWPRIHHYNKLNQKFQLGPQKNLQRHEILNRIDTGSVSGTGKSKKTVSSTNCVRSLWCIRNSVYKKQARSTRINKQHTHRVPYGHTSLPAHTDCCTWSHQMQRVNKYLCEIPQRQTYFSDTNQKKKPNSSKVCTLPADMNTLNMHVTFSAKHKQTQILTNYTDLEIHMKPLTNMKENLNASYSSHAQK